MRLQVRRRGSAAPEALAVGEHCGTELPDGPEPHGSKDELAGSRCRIGPRGMR